MTAAANVTIGEQIGTGRTYLAIITINPDQKSLLDWFEQIGRERYSTCKHSIHLILDDQPLANHDQLLTFRFPSDSDEDFLVSQLRALLRRQDGYERHYRFGPLGMDPVTGRTSLHGRFLLLKPMEFSLLLCLLQAPGHQASYTMLQQSLWSDDSSKADARLRRLVCDLRNKLKGKSSDLDIRSVHGNGYRLIILKHNDRKVHD